MSGLLIFFMCFFGFGIFLVYMLGYFKKIEFIEKEFPGMHVIYH